MHYNCLHSLAQNMFSHTEYCSIAVTYSIVCSIGTLHGPRPGKADITLGLPADFNQQNAAIQMPVTANQKA